LVTIDLLKININGVILLPIKYYTIEQIVFDFLLGVNKNNKIKIKCMSNKSCKKLKRLLVEKYDFINKNFEIFPTNTLLIAKFLNIFIVSKYSTRQRYNFDYFQIDENCFISEYDYYINYLRKGDQ